MNLEFENALRDERRAPRRVKAGSLYEKFQ